MSDRRRDWERLEPLLDQALDLEPEARRDFLRQVGETQPELERRLDQLLEAAEEIALIIDRPLVEVASDLVDKVVDHDLDGALEPGDWVGRYRILREVGAGGMSHVYLVQRSRSGVIETLALKILAKNRGSDELRSRFQRERQILQALRHPNIATLVDRGVTRGGRPFFVLQYIDGPPINDFCQHRDLDLAARVELFVKICDAVDHAHRQGIIHRDLKPNNLLVEERADGSFRPYVLDFGIAHEETSRELTVTGELIGTPGYMSPEQARADHLGLDHRSDIFSLGIVLFELVSGHRPFEGENAMDVLRQLIETDAPPLRQRRPDLPKELDRIVGTCLRRDAALRYRSVRPLIDDLQHFLGIESRVS